MELLQEPSHDALPYLRSHDLDKLLWRASQKSLSILPSAETDRTDLTLAETYVYTLGAFGEEGVTKLLMGRFRVV